MGEKQHGAQTRWECCNTSSLLTAPGTAKPARPEVAASNSCTPAVSEGRFLLSCNTAEIDSVDIVSVGNSSHAWTVRINEEPTGH